jgi:hypothetical protein
MYQFGLIKYGGKTQMFRRPSFVGSEGLPSEFYIFHKYNAIDKACLLKNGDFKFKTCLKKRPTKRLTAPGT